MKNNTFIPFVIALLFHSLTPLAKNEHVASSYYDVVKIKKLVSGHDIVEATINGQKGNFILDTGAITVINDKLVEKYQLGERLNSFVAAGAGGPITISYYPINSIKIGQTQINLDQIGVTDLNQVLGGLYSATSVQLDGIIGQDAFIKGQSILDLSQNTISFPKDTALLNKPLNPMRLTNHFKQLDLVEISFSEYNFKFHGVYVEINGVEKLLLLDSGSSRTMLNQATLNLFKFGDNKNREISTSAGAGSTFSIESLPINELKIDTNKVPVQQIYAIDLSAFVGLVKKHANLDIYGVIGQDILSPLKAIIDSSADKLYLQF